VVKLRYKETERGSSGAVDDGFRRIRCPLCKWQPQRTDRWVCKCRHVWNTFDTKGVCPACSYAWPYTQCRKCKRRSPHAQWYSNER
jgi:hypothetical protein